MWKVNQTNHLPWRAVHVARGPAPPLLLHGPATLKMRVSGLSKLLRARSIIGIMERSLCAEHFG